MKQELFHLKPWTPKLQQTSQDLISQIHEVAPELEVLFMGAAALGLPGKNDLDLDILCDKKDIAAYTQRLIPILGKPKEKQDILTAWEFEFKGISIDAILSDPSVSHVPEQRKVFEKLKADPKLLNKYRKLKEVCDGLPYAEYEKRKKAFFRDILS